MSEYQSVFILGASGGIGSALARDLKSFFERDLNYARKVSKEEVLMFRRPKGKDKGILSLLKLR